MQVPGFLDHQHAERARGSHLSSFPFLALHSREFPFHVLVSPWMPHCGVRQAGCRDWTVEAPVSLSSHSRAPTRQLFQVPFHGGHGGGTRMWMGPFVELCTVGLREKKNMHLSSCPQAKTSSQSSEWSQLRIARPEKTSTTQCGVLPVQSTQLRMLNETQKVKGQLIPSSRPGVESVLWGGGCPSPPPVCQPSPKTG